MFILIIREKHVNASSLNLPGHLIQKTNCQYNQIRLLTSLQSVSNSFFEPIYSLQRTLIGTMIEGLIFCHSKHAVFTKTTNKIENDYAAR